MCDPNSEIWQRACRLCAVRAYFCIPTARGVCRACLNQQGFEVVCEPNDGTFKPTVEQACRAWEEHCRREEQRQQQQQQSVYASYPQTYTGMPQQQVPMQTTNGYTPRISTGLPQPQQQGQMQPATRYFLRRNTGLPQPQFQPPSSDFSFRGRATQQFSAWQPPPGATSFQRQAPNRASQMPPPPMSPPATVVGTLEELKAMPFGELARLNESARLLFKTGTVYPLMYVRSR